MRNLFKSISNFTRWLPAVILLALVMSACSSPTLVPYATTTPLPTPTQLVFRYPLPMGRYDCIAREDGLLVATGAFSFDGNGSVRDEMTGATGIWTYEPTSGMLLFSSTLEILEGSYDSRTGLLALRLRPGVTRTHVEEDILACEMVMQ